MNRKYVFIIILFIMFIKIDVNALNKFKFTEGETYDHYTLMWNCYHEDDTRYAYCTGIDSDIYRSFLYKVDLEKLTIEYVKELGEYLYDDIKLIDNKYYLAGCSTDAFVISIFDLNWNLVNSKTFTTSGGYGTNNYIDEIGGYLYFHGAYFKYFSGYDAIRFSKDLTSSTPLYLSDLSDSDDYELFRAIAAVDDNYGSGSISYRYYDGGILIETTPFDGSDAASVFYKDNRIVWNRTLDGYISMPFINNNKIHYFDESSDGTTSFVILNNDGNVLYSQEVDLLNDNNRLVFSGFTIGRYNNRYYYISYNPGESNSIDTVNSLRVFSVEDGKNININSSSNGTINIVENFGFEGDIVNLDIVADDGYVVDKVTVKDINDNIIEVNNNKFIMPECDVLVSVTFKKKLLVNPNTSSFMAYIILFSITFIIGLSSYLSFKNKNI